MVEKVASSQPLTIADEGVRFQRLTRLLFAALWVVPSLLAAIQLSLVGDASGTPYGFGHALVWQGSTWLLWSLWSQLILSLVTLVPLGAGRMGRWLAVHAVTMCAVCAANAVAIAWLDRTFGIGTNGPFEADLRRVLVDNLDFQVVLYWAVLGAAYMAEFVRRYRERDRVAAELEQKLARTQLDALRMQLNPHFLFNALNSVAELMEMDVREAQRTLTRVSDLLRLSLRSAASAVIPLWQEIELVELYLQIARVRYGRGLDVDIDVDSSAVDLDVPSFLLQPLVENALKHGLAPGAHDQTIRVTAKRAGGALELVVEDNGKGLDGLITSSGRFMAARPSVDGLGIGLTNTRSRLAMLYGDRYAFRMSNHGNGGCRVEIRLPLG
jgi:two-component system, LytTR family, sensor kinase